MSFLYMVLQKDQYTKFSRKKIQSRLLHILKLKKCYHKINSIWENWIRSENNYSTKRFKNLTSKLEVDGMFPRSTFDIEFCLPFNIKNLPQKIKVERNQTWNFHRKKAPIPLRESSMVIDSIKNSPCEKTDVINSANRWYVFF